MTELIRTGASMNRGKSKQDWGTPPAFLAAVTKRFGFIGFDLAARPDNAVAGRFFTEEQDSLKQDWSELTDENGAVVRVGWINPPYADIRPWASKCESVRHLKRWTLLLVPASVDAEWYWDHVHNKAFVATIRGRLKFVGAADPYPKPLLLAAYGYGICGFEPWRWRE